MTGRNLRNLFTRECGETCCVALNELRTRNPINCDELKCNYEFPSRAARFVSLTPPPSPQCFENMQLNCINSERNEQSQTLTRFMPLHLRDPRMISTNFDGLISLALLMNANLISEASRRRFSSFSMPSRWCSPRAIFGFHLVDRKATWKVISSWSRRLGSSKSADW